MGEIGRLFGKPIQVRSLDDFIAVGPQTIPALLVGHDEEDVGMAAGSFVCGSNRGAANKDGKCQGKNPGNENDPE